MKRSLQALALASVVILAACTNVGERTLVSVGYYKVDGETFDELDREIKLHGPRVTGVGKALASTDLRILPSIRYGLSGDTCSVTQARINVKARVTLPKHVDESKLRNDLASAWANLEEYARIHEAVHLAIADRYALKMERAILDLSPRATCPEMRGEVSQVFSKLFKLHHDEQLAFDAAERRRILRLTAQK